VCRPIFVVFFGLYSDVVLKKHKNIVGSLWVWLKVPVISWFDDMSDCELLNLIPFFEALADIDSVYTLLGAAAAGHADTVACSSTNHVDSVAGLLTQTDDDYGGIDITVSTVEDSVEQEWLIHTIVCPRHTLARFLPVHGGSLKIKMLMQRSC